MKSFNIKGIIKYFLQLIFYIIICNACFSSCVTLVIMKYAIPEFNVFDAYYPICGIIIFGAATIIGIVTIIDDIMLFYDKEGNKNENKN